MKRMIALLLFAICVNFNSSLFAQFEKGSWELGLGGAFGAIKESIESGSSTKSNDTKYFLLTLLPGYYVADGFSIEPEIGMTFVEDQEPGLLLIANVSYTNLLKSKTTALFVRLGYGVSNSASIPGSNIYSKIMNELDMSVLNIGAGLKLLISDKAFIRTELNYRNFSWERTNFASSIDYSTSLVTMIIGIGISI